MLDKDKLILAIYVNVDEIDDCDVPIHIQAVNDYYCFDESIIKFIIPVKKSESHIECLTPKIVNDKLADEFINEIKRLEKFIKNFDKNEKKQIN